MDELQKAFLYGFYISKEGYNAECPYRHLASSDLHNPDCCQESFEKFVEVMIKHEEFINLMNQALDKVKNG